MAFAVKPIRYNLIFGIIIFTYILNKPIVSVIYPETYDAVLAQYLGRVLPTGRPTAAQRIFQKYF